MEDPLQVIDRLVAATNAHEIDAIVACFAPTYVNETPAHPLRGFRGREQVRRNWTTILASVPDIEARVLARAVQGSQVWTEWEMTGTRVDGAHHASAGVIVFGVEDGLIGSARFFLEPVETSTGDVDANVQRLTGGARS